MKDKPQSPMLLCCLTLTPPEQVFYEKTLSLIWMDKTVALSIINHAVSERMLDVLSPTDIKKKAMHLHALF